MPEIVYYRVWCKKCQHFELHDAPGLGDMDTEGLKCRECDTVYTDVMLSEIPQEKKDAQRKRWQDAQGRVLMSSAYMMMNPFAGIMLGSQDQKVRVVESDAGQKRLNELRHQKRLEEIAHRKEEVIKFAGLTRNDKCRCGSGLKYKKCCWSRIESY